MDSPYLIVKDLTKIYNTYPVLDKLNLSLSKFEKLGVIGLSGSGKSTLLRLIFGLLDKDNGEIRLENDRVKDRSEVLVPGDDRVKYVRQNYELFPDHTVFENIEHHIRFHSKEYIQKRVAKLLKSFDIEGIRNVKTKLASGGEQQRVAICCALAESPKLLLLDEPMAHLDPINAQQIKLYLWKFINKEKITTIFVTHSSEDALAYASRIAVIHKGKILEDGTPQFLYAHAKKKITAQLLGVLGKIKGDLLPVQFDSNKNYYLRPENIRLGTDITGFEVIEAKFLGGKYLISARHQKNVLHFYHNQRLDVGQKVELSIDIDTLMSCK